MTTVKQIPRPSPQECREALDRLRKEFGDENIRKLLPRKIASPSTHCSHALYRLSIFSGVMSVELRPDYVGSQVAAQTSMSASRYNLPAWYVSEDLMEALVRTELPKDLLPETIHWPLPSLTFFLPESEAMKRTFGTRQPLWITGCVVEPQDHWKENDGRPVKSRILIHIVAELPGEGLTEYHSILRVNDPMGHWMGLDFNLDTESRTIVADFSEAAEQRFAQQMTQLFLSMVMLLGQERPAPGFIEEGEPCPAKGKAKPSDPTKPEDIDRLWMPSWLGKHYRVRKPAIQVGPHGTHASPVLHWRRGHAHTYLTGPGRTVKKLKWIEPILVAAPSEDQPPS